MKPNKQFRKYQAQSISLVMVMCWHAIGRLVLNAMKPNKQPRTFGRLAHSKAKPNKPFRKHQVQSILLVMAMCWASQSSAQPTRAGFDEIAGLARNDKLLNDKLYSSRRFG